ncbi:flavin reductase family protein [Pseudomonas sp. Marseille-QA0332]
MSQATALPAATVAAACASDFRLGMRRLLGGVNILASWQSDGTPVGLCATAVCSVSADPPTLLACVNRNSSLGQAISAGQRLSVNVLSSDDEGLARVFGGMAGIEAGRRFEHGDWNLQPERSPSLPSAAAVFHCQLVQVHEVATHLVLIGQVESVELGDEQRSGSLGYLEGQFRAVSA